MSLSFKFIGQLKKYEKTDKFDPMETKVFDGGFAIKTLKFQAVDGNNKHTLQIVSKFWANDDGSVDEDKTVIHTFGVKPQGSNSKAPLVDIPYAERLTTDLKKIAPYRLMSVNYNADGSRTNENYKKFVFEGDYIDEVCHLLESCDPETRFEVSGNVETQYSATKNTYYQKFVVNRIAIASEKDASRMVITGNFLFDKESWDASLYSETNKVQLKVWNRYYDAAYRKDECGGWCFSEMMLTFDPTISTDAKTALTRYKERFTLPAGCKVGAINLSMIVLNGAQIEEVTYDDLPNDAKEDIALGFSTLEEELRKYGGTAYGEKITEYRLATARDVEESDYTPEDIRTRPVHDAEVAAKAEKKEEFETLSDDDLDIFA